MPLKPEEVEHVARLAHIALTSEEVELMTGQLSSILDHVDRLSAIDTSQVEPTSQVVATENVMRPDEERPSWTPAHLLTNAPRRHEAFFEVDAVLD
jgi:aspartyl-tRNA(Asn)/glutamyl-tRNA(Gln) amidotransferase subunit C